MIKIEYILQFFIEHKTIIRLNISILLLSEKLKATCTIKSKFTSILYRKIMKMLLS